MQTESENEPSAVITSDEFDINNIIITPPKLNKYKKLASAIMNGPLKSGLYIQTEFLTPPFGISFFEANKESPEEIKNYELLLKAYGGTHNNADKIVQQFDQFKSLDEKMIKFGIEYSQTIFKKQYTESQRGIIEDALYNKCVKASVGKDGTVYPDQIKIKIMKDKDTGLPDVILYKGQEEITVSSWDEMQNYVPKGIPLRVIFQARIYFMPGGKYGLSFVARQIELPIVKKASRPTGFSFKPDTSPPKTVLDSATSAAAEEDDEDEDIGDAEADDTEVVDSEADAEDAEDAVDAGDDDADEEIEAEEEPVPEPEPEPVKKKVVKKVVPKK